VIPRGASRAARDVMFGKAALLGCVTAVLWIGCIGDDPSPVAIPKGACSANGEPCAGDAHCLSGFCDRGRCAEIGQKGNYGVECEHGPNAPGCDGYVCDSHRCRSCQSDADCERRRAEGPKCMSVAGWPGKRCVGTWPPPPPPRPPPSGEVPSIAPYIAGDDPPDPDPDICMEVPCPPGRQGYPPPLAPAPIPSNWGPPKACGPPPGAPCEQAAAPSPPGSALPTPPGSCRYVQCRRPPPCSP
jgi:hypothetical protein